MIKLNNVEISQEDLIKEITGNKELMATLQSKFGKQDSGWFVPKIAEKYWFLGGDGIFDEINGDYSADKNIFESQQVFRTKEEAEKADQQRMAKVRILKRIAEENAKEGWVCDWSNVDQYKLTFSFDTNIPTRLFITGSFEFQTQETGFYMSETVAEKLQTELLEDYKIMLGVE